MWIDNPSRKRLFESAGATDLAIADDLIANTPVSSLLTAAEAAT